LGGDAFEGTQRAPGKSVAAHRPTQVEIGSKHQTQNKDTSPPATKYFQIPTSLEVESLSHCAIISAENEMDSRQGMMFDFF
jgi:hypothetical protein